MTSIIMNKYIIGNSPTLPAKSNYLIGNINLTALKVECELLQEEPIVIIITDMDLSDMTIRRIESVLIHQSLMDKNELSNTNQITETKE